MPHKKITQPKYINFDGAGARGIALLGMAVNIDRTFTRTYSGASSGAILAAGMSLGYEPYELLSEIARVDGKKCRDLSLMRLIKKFGLDDGSKLMVYFGKLIEGKGYDAKITLKEVLEKTGNTLMIRSTDIVTKESVYFQPSTHADMTVLDALRCSISVPVLYTPQQIGNHMYVDGCLNGGFDPSVFPNADEDLLNLEIKADFEMPDLDKISWMSYTNYLLSLFTAARQRTSSPHNTITVNVSSWMNSDSMVFATPREAVKFFQMGMDAYKAWIDTPMPAH